jgi:hypothetical protein
MKVLILLAFLIAGLSLTAQEEESVVPVNPETGIIQFREVVKENGTKDELFNRCIYWLNSYYKNSTRVTTIRDHQTGRIEGKHSIRIYYYAGDSVKTQAGTVDYVFNIELKPDKYRYTVTDFKLRSKTRVPIEKWLNKDDPEYNPHWDEYLQQVADFVESWSKSLKIKMKPEVKKTDDDW